MKNINHDEFMNEQLQDKEFATLYLREAILEFSNDGDYFFFFKALERVIKARTTVKQFAQDIGMQRANLVNILHNKTKSPTITTINKILNGLGYEIKIQPKRA